MPPKLSREPRLIRTLSCATLSIMTNVNRHGINVLEWRSSEGPRDFRPVP
ncbi:hypothetical protein BDFB_015329 [Asbolus verrucosus]|uniref:Uncharacterized protein n=1 Tax=Asbolus verrucosus TaxID=1661398 RepID=A0A482VI53_ASBVE|nr:hypothetical protein BDFB_015329 [Asbolus verrucosus]